MSLSPAQYFYNVGQKVLRICTSLSLDYHWYRYDPSPHPTLVNFVQSGTEMIHPDFSGGEGEAGVFSVASALKRFILKQNVITSIFRNIWL